MPTAIYVQNAIGDVITVTGVYQDNSPDLREALRSELPLGIGERAAVQPNIPEYAIGALIEGRTTSNQRVWGVVEENRLGVDLSYRIRGFHSAQPVLPELYDVDVRRESAQVRLVARVTAPIQCGLHRQIEVGRTFFLTAADGETPAREEALHQPLAIHVPCDDESAHALEARTGDQIQLDVARSPWPAPDQKAHTIARLVPPGLAAAPP